jgi:predicted ATPase
MAEPVLGVGGPVADVVGRDAELEVLERALAGAEQHGPCVLAIRGEPGIGKSRLLAELAARAGGRGHVMLAGRAGELERDLPFAVIAQALEPAAARLGRDALGALGSELLEQIAVAVPAVARLAGVEPGVAGERHRVARGVRALLEAVAVERPLTVLLDDVHWADPASTEVLALLVHRPPRARVLIGLAMRSGRAPAVDAAVAAAARAGVAAIVDLSPLSWEAAATMLAPVAGSVRERLYRESGGNPFYLEELARGVSAEAPAGGRAGLVGVPRPVAAALAAELSELAPEARRLLEGAAVAGDPFELDLAAAAADLGDRAALSALDELLAADLVRATEQPRRFRFRHPLVRRGVYEAAAGGVGKFDGPER